MIKEKIIITTIGSVILMVLLESVSIFSNQHDSFIHDLEDKNERIDKKINEIQSPLVTLQIHDWGEDIFYDRTDIYNLYHLLNHANMFGGSYRENSLKILKNLRSRI